MRREWEWQRRGPCCYRRHRWLASTAVRRCKSAGEPQACRSPPAPFSSTARTSGGRQEGHKGEGGAGACRHAALHSRAAGYERESDCMRTAAQTARVMEDRHVGARFFTFPPVADLAGQAWAWLCVTYSTWQGSGHRGLGV